MNHATPPAWGLTLDRSILHLSAYKMKNHRGKRLLEIVLFTAIALFCMYYLWRESRFAAAKSMLASVFKCFKSRVDTLHSDMSWRILNDQECRALLSSTDCPVDGLVNQGTLFDPWHRPLWIAIRKSPRGNNEVIVCSNGPDGVPFTSDDIVSSQANPSGSIGPAPMVR